MVHAVLQQTTDDDEEHTCPRVFAPQHGFLSWSRTSHDTRNRVGLWGVMNHIESWAKSNMGVIFSCMFDLAQDSIWIMTPHSSTLFLPSSEVLWPLQKTILRANTLGHVCRVIDRGNGRKKGRPSKRGKWLLARCRWKERREGGMPNWLHRQRAGFLS